MKVLLVSPTPPPHGGIATWTMKYLDYCKSKEIQVILVDSSLKGKRGERINSKMRLFDEVKRTYKILSYFKNATKEKGVGLVHINSSCSCLGIIRDYICVIMAVRKEIPVVFHCHCNIEDQVKSSLSKKVLCRIVYLSKTVLVLNKKSFEVIERINPRRAMIIPNFIEGDYVEKKRLIREKIERVVFVGHVQKTKGCYEIIKVASSLREIDFDLIGPVSNEMLFMALPSNVHLIGPLEANAVEESLRNADVFLFPSHSEGFSLSLLEAMAKGLPCIATDVGANVDMIENQGGIIVDVGDINGIIAAFTFLSQKGIREKASQWNTKKVQESYVIDKVMDNLIIAYGSII